MKQILL